MSLCENCKRSSSEISKCTLDSRRQHHSFGSRPSMILNNGNKYWHKNGLLHREDGPAIEGSLGDKHYYYRDNLYNKKEWESLIAGKKKFITFEASDKKFQAALFVLATGIILAIVLK